MELIEAELIRTGALSNNLKDRLAYLQTLRIRNLMIPDFSALRTFAQQVQGVDIPIGHLNVISHSNRESIRMVWDLVKTYHSCTIFLLFRDTTGDYEFQDALYQAFSLTDDVGCAFEGEALSNHSLHAMIQTLQDEFKVKDFLVLDSRGFLLPDEISRRLRGLRASLSKDSKVFYFPNNRNGLGLIDALYSMKVGIDGLVGSALKERMNPEMIDLKQLHLLYKQKGEKLFSNRKRKILDKAFQTFDPIQRH